MAEPAQRESYTRRAPSGTGGYTARILAIVAVNLVLVLAAVILASRGDGKLPDINTQTLAIGVLPVSAALGLMLSCRRLDLSLPVILVLALALQSRRYIVVGAPILPTVTICARAGGVGLASALVTWYGRISSALWTGIVAFGLFLLVLGAGDRSLVLATVVHQVPYVFRYLLDLACRLCFLYFRSVHVVSPL